MPCLMGRNSSSRYARCKVHLLTQSQCLGTRIIMIAQHPRGGLNSYGLQTLRIQQTACNLRASNPVLGSDLRIFCNVNFNAGLRIYSQHQTRKNEYPKKRVSKHIPFLQQPRLRNSKRSRSYRYERASPGGAQREPPTLVIGAAAYSRMIARSNSANTSSI